MAPVARVELAIRMSEEVREITLAGIRSRNLGATDEEVCLELLAVLHGRAWADGLAGSEGR